MQYALVIVDAMGVLRIPINMDSLTVRDLAHRPGYGVICVTRMRLVLSMTNRLLLASGGRGALARSREALVAMA